MKLRNADLRIFVDICLIILIWSKIKYQGFRKRLLTKNVFNKQELREPTDERIFVLAGALKQGYSVDKLYELTKIDRWFLHKFKNITDCMSGLERYRDKMGSIPRAVLLEAKKLGFCDEQIAKSVERYVLSLFNSLKLFWCEDWITRFWESVTIWEIFV